MSHAEVGIGEIDAQLRLVVTQKRIEKIGRLAGDAKLEAAQVAGIAMEQAEGFEWGIDDVAAGVENRKAVTVG